MQTFLPYESFIDSARVLDRARLGKQRVENLQIAKALTDPEYGWQNHPAVRMWRYHFGAFLNYQNEICNEWTSRGYRDTCLGKTMEIFAAYEDTHNVEIIIPWIKLQEQLPHWLGDPKFHAAHRSNLLRKDADWYSQFGWTEPNDLEYVWPV